MNQLLWRIEGLRQRNAAGLRSLRRQFSKELVAADRGTLFEIARQLVDSGNAAARFIAYELVKYHREAKAGITAVEVERLGKGISDWAAVDTFACYIAGPAWRAGRINDARIHKWARSKDQWWRRAALVSTVPLNVRAQGGAGDAERTLAVCSLLVQDRAETVVKAMSWALRALAVRDPKEVARFVQRHETELAALVKREVRNKLSTGLKNPKSPIDNLIDNRPRDDIPMSLSFVGPAHGVGQAILPAAGFQPARKPTAARIGCHKQN